jgi:HNH endonuclease
MPSRVPTHKTPSAVPISQASRSAGSAAWKKLIDGRTWRKVSGLYRSRHPLCEWCAHEGRFSPAEHVHHMLGQNVDEMYNFDYLMSLCKSCHSSVTMREKQGETIVYPPRQHDQVDDVPGYS